VSTLLSGRSGARFFAAEAQRTAALCQAMSERFAEGGRLIAVGRSPQARSDARHVAVEFVHPVIVGKRALPALALTAEGGDPVRQLELTAEPLDIVMCFDALPSSEGHGGLTITYGPGGGPWGFDPGVEDPYAAQELIETHYHLLWELVHVFFEHRGRRAGGAQSGGAAAFLYPFLGGGGGGGGGEREHESVVADVAASVLMKAQETAALREQTLDENRDALSAAAESVAERLAGGGRLLALGNGGSATDAMDAVADCRFPPTALTPRAALDLTEDSAILTALANDIGVESLFARQVIAHARPVDALIAFSTSGNSPNVMSALSEARRRGVATVALVGYDGGQIAARGLADHVVVTRSQHIPRIQEAQATAWHHLRQEIG
jgi:D-sedoheptulose 7-phosphate isomerase